MGGGVWEEAGGVSEPLFSKESIGIL